MNHRFNLLPARHVERMAQRRSAAMVGAALLVLIALIVVASVLQNRRLAQAERQRDVEQARNAELMSRRRALAPMRQLTDDIAGRERLLSAAMASQVSWAAVMSSLSTTFPSDASLTSLTAESTLPPFAAVPPVTPGDGNRIIGSTILKGYSTQKFTPGLERTLRLLDTVTGLTEPRLQEGVVKEIGETPVTTFEGKTFVDAAALSRRYADGLPAEHDVKLPTGGGGSAAAPAAPGTPRPSP